MNPKYIAAIEIGSSKIKGIVAAALPDKPLNILAIEDAPAGDAVRYGRIQNAREANDIVNDIIRRLENVPAIKNGHISNIFFADGGRSLLSAQADAVINFGSEEEFTISTLERLQKEAIFKLGPNRDILAVAPRRFFVDAAEVKKIVGAFGSSVRGEFTILTQAPENHRAFERLFIESNGQEVKHFFVTRLLAQTEMALSDSDRQVGTLFIDFGAETTSIAAFREGALVFAATLPIGSANISRDLVAALNVTPEKAEMIKRTKGMAVVDRTKFDAPDDEVAEIVAFVSARAGEIIANVNNLLVEAGLRAADFPGGIVITGGGTRLKGFPEMLEQLTKLKVRNAALDSSVAIAPGVNIVDNFDAISLARYAALHSSTDCIVFPVKKENGDSSDDKADLPVDNADESEPIHHGTPRRGRRLVSEDDPDLLDDDSFGTSIEQPDNVIVDETDLPAPKEDAVSTRRNLLDVLRNVGSKTKDLFKTPFGGEDGGMD